MLTPEQKQNQKRQIRDAEQWRYEKNPYREIINAARRSAMYRRRRDGALPKNEFTMSEHHVVWPTHCPVLGIELHYPGHHRHDPAAASLDRIDDKKGYVPGNVNVVSLRANLLRNNMTKEELRALFVFYNSPWEDFGIEY